MGISFTSTQHTLTYLHLLINDNSCYIFSSFFFLSLTITQVAHTIAYLPIYLGVLTTKISIVFLLFYPQVMRPNSCT